MSKQIFDGYIAKFADPTTEGVEEVFEFLSASGRSPQVYARLYEKVEESVRAGLFFGIWKKHTEDKARLIATLAVFLYGDEVVLLTPQNFAPENCGSFVEIGAALRRLDREGESHPKGVFMNLLLAAPLVQLFSLLGRVLPGEFSTLQADHIICNVQTGAQSDYVRTTLRSPPHDWEFIPNPSTELQDKFKSSTQDPNADREKEFQRFSVNNIPEMAQIVWNAMNDGKIKSDYKGTEYEAEINLDALPQYMRIMIPVVMENAVFFKSLPRHTSFSNAKLMFQKHLHEQKRAQKTRAFDQLSPTPAPTPAQRIA